MFRIGGYGRIGTVLKVNPNLQDKVVGGFPHFHMLDRRRETSRRSLLWFRPESPIGQQTIFYAICVKSSSRETDNCFQDRY